MNNIARDVHVIFNPETEKWEVWELTPIEAFDLTTERFGVDVALHNMNYDDQQQNDTDDLGAKSDDD